MRKINEKSAADDFLKYFKEKNEKTRRRRNIFEVLKEKYQKSTAGENSDCILRENTINAQQARKSPALPPPEVL